MRILVIEDNHRLSRSLAANLTHEGYSVDAAYDGQEGQDLAELTPYDLIIMDILLPEKDGLQVCRDLRRRRIHTPILLLTARDSVDDRVRGLDCGALCDARIAGAPACLVTPPIPIYKRKTGDGGPGSRSSHAQRRARGTVH